MPSLPEGWRVYSNENRPGEESAEKVAKYFPIIRPWTPSLTVVASDLEDITNGQWEKTIQKVSGMNGEIRLFDQVTASENNDYVRTTGVDVFVSDGGFKLSVHMRMFFPNTCWANIDLLNGLTEDVDGIDFNFQTVKGHCKRFYFVDNFGQKRYIIIPTRIMNVEEEVALLRGSSRFGGILRTLSGDDDLTEHFQELKALKKARPIDVLMTISSTVIPREMLIEDGKDLILASLKTLQNVRETIERALNGVDISNLQESTCVLGATQESEFCFRGADKVYEYLKSKTSSPRL